MNGRAGAGVRLSSRRGDHRTRSAAARRRIVAVALLALLAVVAVVRQSGGADARRRATYPIGIRALRLVEPRRAMVLADGSSRPRTLTTYIRYPAAGSPRLPARAGAPIAGGGPFPLVIFGHGFGFTPATYRSLIDAWVRSGYVVAAPMFPLENAYAPGGPYRRDLPNQPGDVRYLMDRLLEASAARSGPLRGLVDRRRIAVAGHSDGGDTALAIAYARGYADPRIRATIVLSGALLPGVTDWRFSGINRPLLAVQGTADRINPPASTTAFWSRAARPKYLLTLSGPGHLAPYTQRGAERSIVSRATLAFLDRYLRGDQEAGGTLLHHGRRPGHYTVQAQP